jgi:hypothetical protein
MNDNARAHMARITNQYLIHATFARIYWPAIFIDLNPRGHALKEASSHQVQSTSVLELRQAQMPLTVRPISSRL